MNTVFAIVGAAFIGICTSQVHLGPIGDPVGPDGSALIDCYTCDDGHHSLPGCLNHVHRCHADQVCAISYGNGDGHANIHCKPKQECDAATANPLRNCTAGGVEVSHHTHHPPHERDYACMKCCETTACVSELANLIKIEAQTTANLMCPGDCMKDDIQKCMDRAHQCGQDEYCKIEKEAGEIWGGCHPDHDYNHCQDEVAERGCGKPASHPASHEHHGPPHHGGASHEPHCFLGCCTSGNCVSDLLNLTTAAPPTTTMMPTTMMPTSAMPTTAMPSTAMPDNGDNTPVAVSSAIVTGSITINVTDATPADSSDCVDNLSGLGCADLSDVCNTVLAATVCPKYCGLCN